MSSTMYVRSELKENKEVKKRKEYVYNFPITFSCLFFNREQTSDVVTSIYLFVRHGSKREWKSWKPLVDLVKERTRRLDLYVRMHIFKEINLLLKL